ncbi:unnamed protein product [Didymodactylos carnosus]|uniref:SH3 domain-containing protein n=1 Tax=Didymodactylos carnosus TaxID=1234261 RepID=A0A813Z7W1_9BILA|nr:unnamed protein product [Didymodactylos carnosus]CAF0895105.1 unnamed protein product [Didymodactylos carnosus]CAF3514698.1 unnamed protein product [Didymodactylos carnosus]CAF3678663.1 unnamed protein product [Didymodactylos carnosus]
MMHNYRRGHDLTEGPHRLGTFDHIPLSSRSTNSHLEPWRSTDRAGSSLLSTTIPNIHNHDLSHALRIDAQLLAVFARTDDKRNTFYSAEIVTKLRQKEQTQSFMNKPCSLYITDRYLLIYDKLNNIIAEQIPVENVDPACVHADVPDTLNDIFMFRQTDGSNNPQSTVVVFKCNNNEARTLVDSIRNASGKPLKHPKSARSGPPTVDRRLNDYNGSSGGAFTDRHSLSTIEKPRYPPNTGLTKIYLFNLCDVYVRGPQYNSSQESNVLLTTIKSSNTTTLATADYYKRLTEELNKCFDDIELFVRYLEALFEYTKELERDRRKDKKSIAGLKQMIEKIPDDRYFIDILQKFKHSFNLLGELKHIIHNPNAPELIHYLLSPLQFILYTLRNKHVKQLQVAKDIWSPALNKEARELLLNCLTSKEHEILRNLGPAWIRTAEDSPQKVSDYRPVFFEGRAVWVQDSSFDQAPQSSRTERDRSQITQHPFNYLDERQSAWPTNIPDNRQQANDLILTRQPTLSNDINQAYFNRINNNNNNNNNGASSQKLIIQQNSSYRSNIDNSQLLPFSQPIPSPNLLNVNLSQQQQQPQTRKFEPPIVDQQRNGIQTNTNNTNSQLNIMDHYSSQLRTERAWAIDRKRQGAQICRVKMDRKGHNSKELTVRREELVEIEDNSKKWWRVKNFRQEVGHVPHNLLEEIEIEQRPIKTSLSNYNTSLSSPGTDLNHPLTNLNSPFAIQSPLFTQNQTPTSTRSESINDFYSINWLNNSQSYINDKEDGSKYFQYLHHSPSYSDFVMQSNNSPLTPVNMNNNHYGHPPEPPAFSSNFLIHPPTPTLSYNGGGTWQNESRTVTSNSHAIDELHEELLQRINDRTENSNVYLNQYSTGEDVQRWLRIKNLSENVMHKLYGFDGSALFNISKKNLEKLINRKDAARLYTLISNQKKISGFQGSSTGHLSQDRRRLISDTGLGSLQSSLKASSTSNDADDDFSFSEDAFSKTLKLKLKQRRDKIDLAEETDRTLL